MLDPHMTDTEEECPQCAVIHMAALGKNIGSVDANDKLCG